MRQACRARGPRVSLSVVGKVDRHRAPGSNGSNGTTHARAPAPVVELAPAPRKPSVYTHPALSNHEIRKVSVHAMCDPRCVVKYLRGLPQPETMRERVRAALRACGLESLVGYPVSAAANADAAARSLAKRGD
jgi:hypothetical protein